MKKHTLNQRLGFTPIDKELVFEFTPYNPDIANPPPYYITMVKPSEKDEKRPIVKLVLAICIGALIGFGIIFLSR